MAVEIARGTTGQADLLEETINFISEGEPDYWNVYRGAPSYDIYVAGTFGGTSTNGWSVTREGEIAVPLDAVADDYRADYGWNEPIPGGDPFFGPLNIYAFEVICVHLTITVNEGTWNAEAGKWIYIATAHVEGGTGPFLYSWYGGGTGPTKEYAVAPGIIITPTCTVTDMGLDNCTEIASGYKKAHIEPGWYCINETGCVYIGVTNQHLVTDITGGPFDTFGSCIGVCNPMGPNCPEDWLLQDGVCVWYGDGAPPAGPPPPPQCGEGYVLVGEECIPDGGSGSGTSSGSGSGSGTGSGSGSDSGSGFPDAGYYCITKASTVEEMLAVLSANGISASLIDDKICFPKGEHTRESIEDLLNEAGLTWRLE